MRYVIFLCALVTTAVLADEPTLEWYIPGRASDRLTIDFPIAQSPLLARKDLVVVAFPPNHILGSNDKEGRRLWCVPWGLENIYIDRERSAHKPYLWPDESRQWGTRAASFAFDVAAERIVAVDSKSGTMCAVDLQRDGFVQWRAFGSESDEPSLAQFESLGPPCIVGNKAHSLVASDAKILCCTLDLATGRPLAKFQLAAAPTEVLLKVVFLSE
ncbi:MAG: hypothetical protein AAGG48_02615 [Planctomycetota bacterium]